MTPFCVILFAAYKRYYVDGGFFWITVGVWCAHTCTEQMQCVRNS